MHIIRKKKTTTYWNIKRMRVTPNQELRSVPHAISAPVHPPKAVVLTSSTFSSTEDLIIGVRNEIISKKYARERLQNFIT